MSILRATTTICFLLVPPSLSSADDQYGVPRSIVMVEKHKGFILRPEKPAADGARPWVWYAPTFIGGHPNKSNEWLFRRLLDRGYAICGVEVGESFGSPAGRKIFSAFYDLMIKDYKLDAKAFLVAQSRGGLMLYNWANENADKVRGIVGIYPVCDLRSYPGLDKAAPAYGMTAKELEARLKDHNPIDRLEPLAKAKVPILHIHGDTDKVVPLEANSQIIADRYKTLGGPVELIVIRGKGHAEIAEFFQSERVLEFFGQFSKAQPVAKSKPFASIPDTVSPEFQEHLKKLTDPALRPPFPSSDDIDGWKRVHKQREVDLEPKVQQVMKQYEPTIVERKLGDVPVLDCKPRGWKESKKLVVYLHGGAYTMASARSSLIKSVPAGEATGYRIISVDYTTAPNAKWQQITDQVVAVVQTLIKEGHTLKDIAMFGDSAGGGMAPGVTLKMRDHKLGMPAAIVLWSPWSDITDTGDTYATLKHAEPTYLYDTILKPAAGAYADPKDQKHPYVSPVYGDYSKGFPPTLIQGGTKEIFLSNFVRQYQAIDAAGGTAKLDIYEGMTHGFQGQLPEAPESKLALKKMKEFLQLHLGK